MNEKDDIKEQFRLKLYDYKAPVPDNEWDRLEKSLNKAMRQRVVRRRWTAAAAAIVVLIVGGLIYLNFPVNKDMPIVTEKITHTDTEEKELSSPIIEKIEIEHSPLVVSVDKNKFKELKKTEVFVEKEVFRPETEELPFVDKGTAKESTNLEEQSETIADEELDRFIEEFVNQRNSSQTYLDLKEKEKKDNIALAFNARGGLTSLRRTTNSPMTLKSVTSKNYAVDDEPGKKLITGNINNMEFDTYQVDMTDNISEMVHEQPLSVGITVAKYFTDRMSLETGLVYTYLYSKAKNTANQFRNQETQQLHYLGIPLNVNYSLLSFHKLNMYVSMGGMIEKDFYGKYQYDETVEPETNSGAEKKVSVSIHQKNPQVSINTGLGLFYPIYDNLGIYGKIGGAYYFDTHNKYKTYYSDKKIVLDMNIGFKINF
jgi:hypothetical protein